MDEGVWYAWNGWVAGSGRGARGTDVDSDSTTLTEVVDESVAVFCSCGDLVRFWSVRSRAGGGIGGFRVAVN